MAFWSSFTEGTWLPYCQVWIGSRSGEPSLVGDSLQKLGIFSDDVTARRFFTSVEVRLEGRKPNTAQIKVVDNFGLMDRGIHAGVPCYIKLGYASSAKSISIEPTAKLCFIGVIQRPSVSFSEEGVIELEIPARDTTDKLRYEKKTRKFLPMPRRAIIQMIMAPYLATSFAPGTVLFETMAQVETGLSQVNMTDLEFLYKLANDWGCTFDVRPVAAINRLTFFFVDDSSDGDLLIGALQPDRNIAPVYRMDWRDGLKNVSSLKFSGEASSRGDRGGVLRRSDTGEMVIVNSDVVGVVDEHDPANWELDQSKVDRWIREHPDSNMDDFYRMAFSMPIPAMHAEFFKRKTVQRFGTPASPDSQDRSGLGAGGFKCDFELVRGDPFLEPNMPVDLGGDVYSRYKSSQVSIGRDVVKAGTSRFVPHTTGMLYWRVAQVTHSFGPDGLKTKGVLKR